MKQFFISVFNTLVRNLDWPFKVLIATCLFLLAFFSVKQSIRRKNDKAPLAWGWIVLSVISGLLAVVYIIF